MEEHRSGLEEKLGVDQIRVWVRKKCKSEAGGLWVDKATFNSNLNSVRRWHDQTSEMMRLIASGEVPNVHFYDLEGPVKRIRVQGSFLEGEEYLKIANSISALSEWTDFLEDSEEYESLNKLTNQLAIDTSVVGEIEKAIDPEGQVRDQASPELMKIRKRIIEAEKMARSALNRILKKSVEDSFSTEGSQVTLRDGRLMIPVRAEFKRNIQGLVHDESATGQTVFLEPAEALELNNEVRELRNQERREVIRILTALADLLREQYDSLIAGSAFLARMDFIHAKASWGREFSCITPEIRKKPGITLHQARHPILWYGHNASKKEVVPLDIHLDHQQRIIVISGPNAGGKSVALKTVGLLQFLVQCGFPVPVDERSSFSIYHDIMLDIGDTQSLEDDLSTYSAHLKAMKSFISSASKKTMILIDEFGKGTEPQFGGAIAEAILGALEKTGCYGVVTTHYQNLKDLADSRRNMVNGAMMFDVTRLEPRFRLEIGKPGSSFAFEISAKIGLPQSVIDEAKKILGHEKVDFDQSLVKMERERARHQKLAEKLEQDQRSAVQLKKDYEGLKQLLVDERKQIIREAKLEAKKLIEDANKEIERTIRTIKESGADKQRTKEARSKLEEKKEKLTEMGKTRRSSAAILQVGDVVKMEGHDGEGMILRVKGKEAEVQFGGLKSFVKIERLQKIGVANKRKESRKDSGYNKLQSVMDFSHELSIRGMRAEVALPELDKFVDQAILVGANEVRILHGKGHGILRELVRNHLHGHPHISSMKDEHADRGGSGITIISFK